MKNGQGWAILLVLSKGHDFHEQTHFTKPHDNGRGNDRKQLDDGCRRHLNSKPLYPFFMSYRKALMRPVTMAVTLKCRMRVLAASPLRFR
jgi:hypothetical protein